MQQNRRFCLTSYSAQRLDLQAGFFSFVAGQREKCPTTGREHWQVYVETTTKRTFNGVLKVLTAAYGEQPHLEACVASVGANLKYVSKSETSVPDSWYQIGTPLARPGGLSGAATKILQGNATPLQLIADEPDLARHFRTLQALRTAVVPQVAKEQRQLLVAFITGIPGSGKSHRAREMLGTQDPDCLEYHSGFITGYRGSDGILLEDVTPGSWPRAVLLRMLDKYPYEFNIKGGTDRACWTRVVITTNFPLSAFDIKGDATFSAALKRRITDHIVLDHVFAAPTLSNFGAHEASAERF